MTRIQCTEVRRSGRQPQAEHLGRQRGYPPYWLHSRDGSCETSRLPTCPCPSLRQCGNSLDGIPPIVLPAHKTDQGLLVRLTFFPCSSSHSTSFCSRTLDPRV